MKQVLHYILVVLLVVILAFFTMKWSSAKAENTEITIQENCGQQEQKNEGKITMEFTKTGSGLQYALLTSGTGVAPKKGQRVQVHYTGWLLGADGQPGAKFDSSVDRGEPFVFVLGIGQVIRGWDEGVALLKVGDKARFIIPPALGYGAYAMGHLIPANSTLVFDVELLAVR